ncbi:MAG: hypothetical protein K2W96_22490 [Gemmataceae bacterium]|nr:hypothetical protein [Gemmataceae bacterium]
MAKKKPPAPERASITPERFRRLHAMLRHLAGSPRSRDQLAKLLSLDVRGFYRDLEAVRAAGIGVVLADGLYSLAGSLDAALGALPFPDPQLTLGQARALAKGRGKSQAALAALVGRLTS